MTLAPGLRWCAAGCRLRLPGRPCSCPCGLGEVTLRWPVSRGQPSAGSGSGRWRSRAWQRCSRRERWRRFCRRSSCRIRTRRDPWCGGGPRLRRVRRVMSRDPSWKLRPQLMELILTWGPML